MLLGSRRTLLLRSGRGVRHWEGHNDSTADQGCSGCGRQKTATASEKEPLDFVHRDLHRQFFEQKQAVSMSCVLRADHGQFLFKILQSRNLTNC
jgi:hypothetical protein